MRQRLQHLNRNDRDSLAAQLPAIYSAPSEVLAAWALATFEQRLWAARYPPTASLW